jgi:hypothetical protein
MAVDMVFSMCLGYPQRLPQGLKWLCEDPNLSIAVSQEVPRASQDRQQEVLAKEGSNSLQPAPSCLQRKRGGVLQAAHWAAVPIMRPCDC